MRLPILVSFLLISISISFAEPMEDTPVVSLRNDDTPVHARLSSDHEGEESRKRPVAEPEMDIPACENVKFFRPVTSAMLKQVILDQYKDPTNNYEDAEDFCWVRAHKMATAMVQLHETNGIDPKGPDGVWGTDDDKVKKIIIRYPSGHHWRYHIAACVRNEKGKLRVCDPIDAIIELRTRKEWSENFAETDTETFTVKKCSVADRPDSKTCHVEVKSILAMNPNLTCPSLQAADAKIQRDQDMLTDRISDLIRRGEKAYPDKDEDHDGVPDTADECPGTPADTPVDHTGC